MTATENKPETAGLSRRGFLQRSAGGFAAAIAITSTGALLNASEAWALDVKGLKPETMKTLILVARDIYPHDKVADRYYAIAMKGYDDKAVGNPEMKAQIEGFVAALDGAAGEGGYVGRPWEAERVAIPGTRARIRCSRRSAQASSCRSTTRKRSGRSSDTRASPSPRADTSSAASTTSAGSDGKNKGPIHARKRTWQPNSIRTTTG